jgi:hypothetical protein
MDGPLVAYRVWSASDDRLRSLTGRESWSGQAAIEAKCDCDHEPPAEGCVCGLYGMDSLRTLRRYVPVWGSTLQRFVMAQRVLLAVVGVGVAAGVVYVVHWAVQPVQPLVIEWLGMVLVNLPLEHVARLFLGALALLNGGWWSGWCLVVAARGSCQAWCQVEGAVLLWGQVVVGEAASGGYLYRARHARVIALADSPAARIIASKVGVPVVPARALSLHARTVAAEMAGEVSA